MWDDFRTRLLSCSAISAVVLAACGACAEPTAAPGPSPRTARAAATEGRSSDPTLRFPCDGGTCRYWAQYGVLGAPDGTGVQLAPDAWAYYDSVFADIARTGEQLETLERLIQARIPPPTCNPRFQPCPPARPLASPATPAGAGVEPRGVGLSGDAAPRAATLPPGGSEVRLQLVASGPGDWTCRDISLAIYQQTRYFHGARSNYYKALQALGVAAAVQSGALTRDERTGVFVPPEPKTVVGLFAAYVGRWGSLALFELAAADYQAARAAVGFYGTLFNLYNCLEDGWEAPRATEAAGLPRGGGSGGGTLSGVTLENYACYFWVGRRTDDGSEIFRIFLGCVQEPL